MEKIKLKMSNSDNLRLAVKTYLEKENTQYAIMIND